MVGATPQEELGRTENRSRDVYIGIDPGASGGVAWICRDRVWAGKMPDTEGDRWELILSLTGSEDSATKRYACIEQQTPRPTRYRDKATGVMVSSVLASTVTLYGAYMQLRAFLTCAEIPYEDVPSQRWQGGLKIVRAKGEADTSWKNRLKTRAQQLFPSLRVTLATADALLLAEYCRRVHEGTLER